MPAKPASIATLAASRTSAQCAPKGSRRMSTFMEPAAGTTTSPPRRRRPTPRERTVGGRIGELRAFSSRYRWREVITRRPSRLDEAATVASQGVKEAPHIGSEQVRCLDERNVADVEVHLQSTSGDRLLGRKMISQRDVPIAISADQ